MANENIRCRIEAAGVKYWQVADAAGVSPYTLSLWLRHELTGNRLERVMGAVNALCGGENGGHNTDLS